MTDPTEAEARESLLALMSDHAVRDIGHACESCAADLDTYAEAVRATEREKVRALVERLTAYFEVEMQEGNHCFFCAGNDEDYLTGKRIEYLEHTADCPWVEARLWLERDEVPE